MKYPQLVSMPSAVSDWLEEQLEARGIDSEIYTRYILSLLLAHKLDFIYPEDDFPNSGQSKKRQRIWGRRSHTDVEQLKRSAAVECLMSAAEQSCEIESLVDELCAKLKAANKESDNSSNVGNTEVIFKEPVKPRKISPEELAKKYYAAFPPLNSKVDNRYFESNIGLSLDKWPSDKSGGDLAAAKFANPVAFETTTVGATTGCIEADTHRTLRQNMIRIRSSDLESESALQAAPDFEEDDFYRELFEKYLLNGICKLVDESIKDSNEGFHEAVTRHVEPAFTPAWLQNERKWTRFLDDFENDFFSKTGMMEAFPRNTLKEEYPPGEDNPIKDKHYRPREYIRNQWVSYGNLWDVINHYENRPNTWSRFSPDVDVRHFGVGPRNMNQVSLCNMLLQQDEEFSKTDRVDDSTSNDIFSSSIFNTNYGFNYCNNNLWWTRQLNPERQNNFINYLFDNRIMGLIRKNDSMNEKAYLDHRHQLSIITDEEFLNGPFIKKPDLVARKGGDLLKIATHIQSSPSFSEDQHLTSSDMYFETLDVLLKRDQSKDKVSDSLPDGTFFNVKSELDMLNFQRSPSGSLFLESESGKMTKYFEYKYQSPTDESMRLPRIEQSPDYQEFKVKFPVSTNDKACQTDYLQYENMISSSETRLLTSTPNSMAVITKSLEGEKEENDEASSTCSSRFTDGSRTISELDKLFETESDDDWKQLNNLCRRCNLWSNASWLGFLGDRKIGDGDQPTNIWENNELSERCRCTVKMFSPLITRQIRQECNDEDDKHLFAQIDHYWRSCGMDEIVDRNREKALLKRRRHSNASDLWDAFPTRIDADCVISSSSLPTRCPVAL